VGGKVVLVIHGALEGRGVINSLALRSAQVRGPPAKGANGHDHVVACGEDGHILVGGIAAVAEVHIVKDAVGTDPGHVVGAYHGLVGEREHGQGPFKVFHARVAAAVGFCELVGAADVDPDPNAALRDPFPAKGHGAQLKGEARGGKVPVSKRVSKRCEVKNAQKRTGRTGDGSARGPPRLASSSSTGETA